MKSDCPAAYNAKMITRVWCIAGCRLVQAAAARAEWQGTRTSYSLPEQFGERPGAAGRSAVSTGLELPVTGGC